MSRKALLGMVAVFILVLNAAVLGSLYLAGIIWQPTEAELEAIRLAEEEAKKAAELEARYSHLEPLPEPVSRVGYVRSLGEAVTICENTLQTKEKARKSWSVNYIESRYVDAIGLYKIFIDYETIPPAGQEKKYMKVTCEVEEATKVVSNWKPMKAE